MKLQLSNVSLSTEVIKDLEMDIEKVVMATYINIFRRNKNIPELKQIMFELEMDHSTKAYDIIYGINKDDLSETNVISVLSAGRCIFDMFGHTCCDAQLTIYDKDGGLSTDALLEGN